MIQSILNIPFINSMKDQLETITGLNKNTLGQPKVGDEITIDGSNGNGNVDRDTVFKKKDDNGNTVEIDLDTFDHLNQQDVVTYVKQILNLDTSFPNNYLQNIKGRTYHELEFFSTNDTTESTKSFFQHIDNTHTFLGRYYFQHLLLNPLTNITLLKNRQQCIKMFDTCPIEELINDMIHLSTIENQVLSIYRPDNEETKTILDTVYFQFRVLQPLNYNQKFLNGFNIFVMFVSPFYGIISPILLLITPVLFMKYVLKADVSMSNYFKLMKQMFFKSTTSSSIFHKILEHWNTNIENYGLRIMMKLLSYIIYIINSPFGRYGYLVIIFISYLYSIYNYFTTTKTLNKIINYLHRKINKLVVTIKIVNKYFQKYQCFMLQEENSLVTTLTEVFKNPLIQTLLNEPLFNKDPSWCSNKGIILKTFKLIHDELNGTDGSLFNISGMSSTTENVANPIDTKTNLFTPIFQYIAILDTYLNICTLKSKRNNVCFTSFVKNNTPYINIENLWNVCCNDAVTNDLKLGMMCLDKNVSSSEEDIINIIEEESKEEVKKEEVKKEEVKKEEVTKEEVTKEEVTKEEVNNTDDVNNIIVTGPNGSGKSTYIKSILETIILSQTIGIGFCSSIQLTPFHNFITHLNIPDCQGKESLFQAEMNRCFSYLNQLNTIEENNQFSFNIIDEIFVSTNYLEGASGAYAIIKKIGLYKNSLSIVTTHFDIISKMNHNNTKKQYFSLDIDKTGEITGNYKIKEGINEKHMAIQLLKRKGFDDELIQDAEKMYSYLTKNNKEKVNEEVNEEVKEEVNEEVNNN